MKHLKRLAAILLAAAMLLSLAACAEKQPTPSGNASDPAGSTSAPSETSGNTLATAASLRIRDFDMSRTMDTLRQTYLSLAGALP